jgi:hypothetical protein
VAGMNVTHFVMYMAGTPATKVPAQNISSPRCRAHQPSIIHVSTINVSKSYDATLQ